ncbi:MAG: hypothetical protein Greene071421_115 [Parcubacteria group bacterium Greene0714_21]|nr:MAG: hypothetical protein Greene041639_236 [Parcubacteria group bacterium Greene0416_39]TSC98518.1 MAG: hypothetical protein Greene101447_20 [Parcubacteria group bacterium Greene1014_47]TSD04279.1 MAG: hypothetical protein Greene071421_115 [Parcubacteria group bacterium Greene0714_21]
MKLLGPVASLLTVIGGLNWGLVALANFNLVDTIFGSVPAVGKIVYVLIGLSALYVAITMLPKQFSTPKP